MSSLLLDTNALIFSISRMTATGFAIYGSSALSVPHLYVTTIFIPPAAPTVMASVLSSSA